MRRVRQIERFSDECHEIQLQQLTQLLDEAKNTEYGRKYWLSWHAVLLP